MSIFILILLFFFPFNSFASSPGDPITSTTSIDLFEQYKTDYLFQKEIYQKRYLEYTQKKQIYTKYGTLTTKQEKNIAQKNVLIARNNMLKSYLLALRVFLDQSKPAYPTETEKFKIEISKFESWLNEQNLIVSNLNNEEDIISFSKEFNKKFINMQSIIYSALTQNQINRRQIILDDLKVLTQTIQESSKIKPESQEWLSPITVKNDLILNSFDNTLKATQQEQILEFSNFYPKVQKELTKTDSYLYEILTDLKSVVIKFYQK